MDATEEVAEPSSGDILPSGGHGRRYHILMYVVLAIAGLTVLGVGAGVALSRHGNSPSKPAAPALPLVSFYPPAGTTEVNPNS
ncbi:MAG: hypothetical protein JO244_13185, partial [Solirubrobacterales bacterium]|nr:hypothetical protein [Solirubrobacterales bacterium]